MSATVYLLRHMHSCRLQSANNSSSGGGPGARNVRELFVGWDLVETKVLYFNPFCLVYLYFWAFGTFIIIWNIDFKNWIVFCLSKNTYYLEAKVTFKWINQSFTFTGGAPVAISLLSNSIYSEQYSKASCSSPTPYRKKDSQLKYSFPASKSNALLNT